ncbi:MAG: ShlB/FhaC/HecB family hemolysin secretion/activation protein [Candidatus Electrothrix sp. GW3-4]|uniref:ShlB/FhaC/HecB family hemolysin secretion/activation protein n=1 Tax=Candidatus Electrothrix sp. GW3-4 TaxID=3126740 RepID=UPI0030CFFD08
MERGLKYVVCAGLLLMTSLNATELIAQSSDLLHAQKTRQERPALPDYAKPNPPELVLPPVAPTPKTQKRLSEEIKVNVKEFRLTGNTVFTDNELATITKNYKNNYLTSEEIQEVRRKLTLFYVNQGYINSGAIIPDQKMENGILDIQIIEGKLTAIEVRDNKWLRTTYITERISPNKDAVLNINELRERLQILQQDPLVLQFHAQLKPGIEPGESILVLKIREDNPWQLNMTFANDRSPSIGAERLFGYVAHRSISKHGDTLAFKSGFTNGADDFGLSYSYPLTANDTLLSLKFNKNESVVIEEPFDSIDIDSEMESYGISISHPFYRTPQRLLSTRLALERRHSETFLLGEPFSFSPGAVDGKSDVTVVRFTQEWLSRSLNQVISVYSTFNLGIDAFGGTDGPEETDGQYLSWLGQFQWARRFTKRGDQIIFRTDVQLANDSLLSIEKMAIGGASTVRGYRENQLIRDNAVVASLELRLPLFRLPIPKISRRAEDGMLHLVPFGDFGQGWNTHTPTPNPDSISSLGVGLRWDPSSKIHAEIYWGYPLRDLDTPYEDLQDDGIHFKLSYFLF